MYNNCKIKDGGYVRFDINESKNLDYTQHLFRCDIFEDVFWCTGILKEDGMSFGFSFPATKSYDKLFISLSESGWISSQESYKGYTRYRLCKDKRLYMSVGGHYPKEQYVYPCFQENDKGRDWRLLTTKNGNFKYDDVIGPSSLKHHILDLMFFSGIIGM